MNRQKQKQKERGERERELERNERTIELDDFARTEEIVDTESSGDDEDVELEDILKSRMCKSEYMENNVFPPFVCVTSSIRTCAHYHTTSQSITSLLPPPLPYLFPSP